MLRSSADFRHEAPRGEVLNVPTITRNAGVRSFFTDLAAESAGLTLSQLAQVMKDLGCTTAYNLDGGGSTTMVVKPHTT